MKQNIKQLLFKQTYKIQELVSALTARFSDENAVCEGSFIYFQESLIKKVTQ